MTKENHNWWDDPKNKEVFNFPISVVSDSEWWIATCNDDTELLLGDKLHGCAQGKTKEEAIKKMFQMIKFEHEFSEECRLNYQRWVPFRKGDWKHIGGTWFIIFGINFYFRYGKGMKGGKYIPFTNLNISITNEWTIYRNWKQDQKKNDEKTG